MKKKVLKIISLLVLAFGFWTNANAADFDFNLGDSIKLYSYDGKKGTYIDDEEETHYYYQTMGFDSGILYGSTNGKNGKGFNVVHYNASKNGNGPIPAYCMDPNLNGGGTESDYYVERMFFYNSNGTKYSGSILAQDAGLLEILANGSNQYVADPANDKKNYLATNMAVRAWIAGFGSGLGNTDDKYTLASSYANLAVEWFSQAGDRLSQLTKYNCTGTEDEIKTCYEDKLQKRYSAWYNPNYKFTPTNDEENTIIAKAHELFNKGIQAAYDYINRDSDKTASIQASVSVNRISKEEDNINVIINIKDLPAEGYVKVKDINCPNCRNLGITIGSGEYKDGNEWKTLTADINLAQFVDSSNNAYVRYIVSKEDKGQCDALSSTQANFSIDYETYDPNEKIENSYKGAYLKSTQGEYSNQRFVIITQDSEIKPKTLNGTLKANCLTKEDICKTQIDSPFCSNVKDDAKASIIAKDRIKYCIINEFDDAGNTYKLETQASVSSNPYCSVFCKEDYPEISYNPIIQNLNCGGYFKLSAHIEGKKSCYTAGTMNGSSSDYSNQFAIDESLFTADVARIQTDLAAALSNYSKYTAWANATIPSPSTSPVTCGGSNCGDTYTYNINLSYDIYTAYGYDINPNRTSETLTFSTSCSCGTTQVEKKENGQTVIDPKTGKPVMETVSTCPASCPSSSEAVLSGTSYTIGNFKSSAKSLADKYYQDVKDLQSRLNTAIVQYNSCTTGWTNEYAFDQKLKYEYDQIYYNYLTDNQRYLQPVDDLETKEEIAVCESETNDEYECLGGWKYVEVNQGLDNYAYSSNYQNVFKWQSMTIASIDGGTVKLSQPSIPVSKAKFVRKTVEKEQSYISPNIAYQIDSTGYITTDGTYSGNEVNLSPVPNGLPISNGTVFGGITKITLYGLGEFYGGTKAGTSGRLVDFDNNENLKSDTVAFALGENWNSGVGVGEAGEFYCEFISKCRPKDCPTCEWECVPGPDGKPDCSWHECPACKVTCINCMFNLDELQLNFKSISTSNFGSADRKMGYNWVTETTLSALQLLSQKATVTMNEITTSNETIYDNDGKTNGNSNLAFSIRMTPEVTNFIQDFNSDIDESGMYDNKKYGKGYANDTLTCYDDVENGYNNLYCYSDFIDLLVGNFETEISGLNNRPSVDTRKTNPNPGYWTLWVDGNPGVTNGYVKKDCPIDDPNYPNCHVDNIGGPAWK